MTCKTCRFWTQGEMYSSMDRFGLRTLLYTYALGNCSKIVPKNKTISEKGDAGFYDVISPLDSIICDTPCEGNQSGCGEVNSPKTGPNFGCIHWEKVK